MSMKKWQQKVLGTPGAAERVAEIEDELRLAAGLTRLREQAGLSQRDLAKRLGISQPRIVAIERSRNVTVDVLDQYVGAVGGQLEITVRKGTRRIPLVGAQRGAPAAAQRVQPAGKARRVDRVESATRKGSRGSSQSSSETRSRAARTQSK